VHTKDGLRPIEQIKVGDYVLSKPESGEGELSYQPVTRTYQYEDRELYFVTWSARKEHTTGEKPIWDRGCMAVTGGHPIWVKQLAFYHGLGLEGVQEFKDINIWMTIEDLYRKILDGFWNYSESGSWGYPVHAELADGRVAVIEVIKPILQSDNPDVGVAFNDDENWYGESLGKTLRFGAYGVQDKTADRSVSPGYTNMTHVDISAYDYNGYDTTSEMSVIRRSGGYLPMRRRVFNLEIAQTHTYFVGELGIWVHNSSGIVLTSSLPLTPTQNLGVYVGERARANFKEALAIQSDGKGLGVVPDINVGTKAADVQVKFNGSIAGPAKGMAAEQDKLYGFALGYRNPIDNGDPFTVLGDALAYVYKPGGQRLPSNVFIDVKSSSFGNPTGYMWQYINADTAVQNSQTLGNEALI
jgi:hypothetical protein